MMKATKAQPMRRNDSVNRNHRGGTTTKQDAVAFLRRRKATSSR